jgi:hypothetical protein
VSFEDQLGTHGGLGGPQEIAFLIFPAERSLRPQAWQDARDFHAFLSRAYARVSEAYPF